MNVTKYALPKNTKCVSIWSDVLFQAPNTPKPIFDRGSDPHPAGVSSATPRSQLGRGHPLPMASVSRSRLGATAPRFLGPTNKTFCIYAYVVREWGPEWFSCRGPAIWSYATGTAQIFWVPLIISGTGKAANFKFSRYIQRVHANKSPLKLGRKGSVGVSRDCRIFFSTPFISGTDKATNFQFCTHIRSINRNKSRLQISGKVAVC